MWPFLVGLGKVLAVPSGRGIIWVYVRVLLRSPGIFVKLIGFSESGMGKSKTRKKSGKIFLISKKVILN